MESITSTHNRNRITAFNGLLVRHETGVWTWKDGTQECRVRDMKLAHLAPNWRVVTYADGSRFVEVPPRWWSVRHWPCGCVDTGAAKAIESLLWAAELRPGLDAETTERLDNSRATQHYYQVPIHAWDNAMAAIAGAQWSLDDQADLLVRAKSYGL